MEALTHCYGCLWLPARIHLRSADFEHVSSMFFVFKNKSDSFKWSNSLKCQLLLIGHYFVESWGDKSTYLFPFWQSVSLILPTTSCIVYRALHCCSVTHSIVNRTLHSLAMQSYAIIWEFCAVTFAYETYEIVHVYCIFYSGFMFDTTVFFGITKDGSLVFNTFASWNCFTCRNLFQNGANDMSECLTYETAFFKKAQKKYVVRIIRFWSNFASLW